MFGSTQCGGIKPGDPGVMIGIQVDEFTCTWSAGWFIAHSQIYPGLVGKVSSLTHFPLAPGCGIISFLDQAVADSEQGLDSILTDSIESPELDKFLDEPDVITPSVSSGFLCLVSTVSNSFKNHSLLPASGLINYGARARALLTCVPGHHDVGI